MLHRVSGGAYPGFASRASGRRRTFRWVKMGLEWTWCGHGGRLVTAGWPSGGGRVQAGRSGRTFKGPRAAASLPNGGFPFAGA